MKRKTDIRSFGNIALQRVAFVVVLVVVWLSLFPHTLTHIEETAYWVDAPDMSSVIYQWPQQWAELWGAWLSQFFLRPFWGAVILALLALLALLAADVVLWRLFRQRFLLWLSFIPAVWVALSQTGNSTLAPAVRVVTILWMIALVVLVATLRGPLHRVRRPWLWMPAANAVLPYVAVVVVAVVLATSGTRRQTEFVNEVEHLAAQRQWDRLYDLTYSRRHELDDNLMSYSLLALSQRGQLSQQLFHYPVRGLENVYTSGENFRFNSFFCHELGLPNEAIRFAFEEGQYMPAGASFGTLRRMTDWLLEKGDDPQLADFYLNLLSHSSCHKRFVNARRAYLLQPQQPADASAPEYVGSPSFLHEAAVVLDRDPRNERARDYLLCGMLLMGNTEGFLQLFEQLYVQTNDHPIPTHYMEALVALAPHNPHIEASYSLPPTMQQRYRDFLAQARQGGRGRQQAADRYRDTYWAYQLRLAEKAGETGMPGSSASGPVVGPEFGN